MMHLLDCELVPGASYVLSRSGLTEALTDADLVITGEGCLDRQTLMGKGPAQVIAVAREHHVPVVVVCGMVAPDFDIQDTGIIQAIAVSDGLSHDEAMDHDGTLKRVALAVSALVEQSI